MRPVRTDAKDPARVVAGTVVYDRSGAVVRAPVIAEFPDGSRVAAGAAPGLLAGLAGTNLVGESIRVDGVRYEI